MTYPEKRRTEVTRSPIWKALFWVAGLFLVFLGLTIYSNFVQGAEVTVIRGDTPYRADAVEVFRGNSDYLEAPFLEERQAPEITPQREFFMEYDEWRARVIQRKLNPRP